MKRGRNTLGLKTQHGWERNSAVFFVHNNSYGQEVCYANCLDFDEIQIARGGLLEKIIRDAPCPLSPSVVGDFKRFISGAAQQENLRLILGAPPETLSDQDILLLARFADDEIRKWKRASPYDAFIHAWTIFRYSKSQLSTGNKVSEVFYKSEHKYVRRRGGKSLISDFYDDSFKDPMLAAPIGVIRYNGKSDLAPAAILHLQSRLDNIQTACVSAIERHLALVRHIKHAKNLGLPETLRSIFRSSLESGGCMSVEPLARLPPEDKFRVILYVLERDKWFKSRPLISNVRLADYEILTRAMPRVTTLACTNLLLSDYFLPRHIVVTCIVLVGIKTAWNPSTILSLSPEDIRKKNYGYELTGIKAKTDQLQSHEVIEDISDENQPLVAEVRDAAVILAIDLLLANVKSAKEYGECEGNYLFLSPEMYGSGVIRFGLPRIPPALADFCSYCNLQKFTLRQLRDQVANLRYMTEGQDEHVVRALLGHANSGTTAEYLATRIVQALHEANVNRYVAILEKSILFSTGRETKPRNDDIEMTVAKRLMFPVSSFADDMTECTVDKWINSGGKITIVIGVAEIQHCALQRLYYIDSIPALMQANPERFLSRHLPRIVICYALYRLIEASSHRAILRGYEESLDV